MKDDNLKEQNTTTPQTPQEPSAVACYVPEKVQKEIDRIKKVAEIYVQLQSLMPSYGSEYMDAFVELANRFDAVGA